MSSIKVKKLTLQYSYLLLEKQEVDEICLESDKEMRQMMREKYPDEYKEIFERRTTEHNLTNTDESSEEIETSKSKKNKDAKKLYRKIADKTHPDKTGSDNRADLFSKASLAYQENDLATLLDLAGSLNIELTELSPESIQILENNVISLSKEINTQKSTTAWAFHVAKTDEDKDVVLRNIINHLKGA
tara:strand:- start:158 stop:721 length:564 start_codon:yes stop_codon:yes gene_type:complete